MKSMSDVLTLRRGSLKETASGISTAAIGVQKRSLAQHGKLILFIVAACLVPLSYALYTNHMWEDFFITFRFSQNLVEGKGLVYNPGERVHGFTSPIGVLLPALCYLLTGQSSYLAALWLFRILSIAAYATGGVLLLQSLKNTPINYKATTWFLAAVYLFDVKAVAYSMNGMETAFMLLFLAWGFYLLAKGQLENWLARGACWAGLMWTRPDGCIYIAALAVAEIVFYEKPRKQTLVSLAKSAGIAAVLYLPWFIWAWSYYGSPVPHTVIAKSNIEQGVTTHLLHTLANMVARFPQLTAQIFQPIFYWNGYLWLDSKLWPWILNKLTMCMGAFAAIYWLVPVNDRLGRMASFCFAVASLYLSSLLYVYAWYLPPAGMLGLFAIARGIPTIAGVIEKQFSWDRIYSQTMRFAFAVLAVIALGEVAVFAITSVQMKIQEKEVEMGNRARIGEWLRQNGRPDQKVYLEPLGYIGYFSGMRMFDWPGLVSPEVVRLRREKGLNQATMISEIKPDWVVLRPSDLAAVHQSSIAQEFDRDYSAVKVFDVTPTLNRYAFIPGKNYIYFDASYTVFKRNRP